MMNAPPRMCLPALWLVLILVLVSMAGRVDAGLVCYAYWGLSYLADPDYCWASEINAAFNGQLDGCKNGGGWKVVSRCCTCRSKGVRVYKRRIIKSEVKYYY